MIHTQQPTSSNQPPPNPPTTQPPHAPVRGSVFLSNKTDKNRVAAARSRLVEKTPRRCAKIDSTKSSEICIRVCPKRQKKPN